MRRAGQNPTEAEVQDMINEIDVDGSGFLEFTEFCLMMHKKLQDYDMENDLKETFRVFSKDDEGCITAEELKFVLTHLPGKVCIRLFSLEEFGAVGAGNLLNSMSSRSLYEEVSAMGYRIKPKP
jgi:Ca2+-binding EF-hand superfamily protein